MATSFIVEDGSGKSDANSYVTLAEANDYDDNYHADAQWNASDNAAKKRALRIATQYLDNEYNTRWVGAKKTNEQSLDWPRLGAEDSNGYAINDSSVPAQVKSATVEAAIKHVNGIALTPDTSAAIKRKKVKAGPVEQDIEYVAGKTETTSFNVIDDLLDPITIGGGVNVPLYRA